MALAKRGKEMIEALGYSIEPGDRVTSFLRANVRKFAVAVFLQQTESPELQAERFTDLSPVAYGLSVADRENLPWVVVLHGAKIRVYSARVGLGVGRRGRTETYVECHSGFLAERDAGFLWLLCSAEALVPGGTLEQLLEASARYSGDLAERLRERIYESVVPALAEGIADARHLREPTADDLAAVYEAALTVLFRLLFIAYGEDKDLLPYRLNELYRRRSLKTKAQELARLADPEEAFNEGDALWSEVQQLFRAVDQGNRAWGVPAYNGGLFAEDGSISLIGQQLAGIAIPDTVFGPALRDLLVIEGDEGLGPVDFRSLGVREFGTIYEGLLESELAVAETDLVVDADGIWRPAGKGDTPEKHQGEVYLHDASGARKSTGSYFTKAFAVEHLLERSLEPALGEHLGRLDRLDEAGAGERFFDFRVADLAMGSGHFLVAAIDRIERGLTGYLSRRSLPGVVQELASLRSAAVQALGDLADQVEIDDAQLLRRLIARRCIYGVDLNPIAVQLARLSVWIHTFVPGLPLSLLDHNLVRGNSLVGIGRLEEIQEAFERQNLPMFAVDARTLLGAAVEPLRRLANIADATPKELERARSASAAARKAVAPAEALCDVIVAARTAGKVVPEKYSAWETVKKGLVGSAEHLEAKRILEDLEPLHFPMAFPEVFLRQRPGFDVIVGNPPWEKLHIEEHEFWARYMPGVRGVRQSERERLYKQLRRKRPDLERIMASEMDAQDRMRQALMKGPYPGMGAGHPDLYKAFSWRFLNLVTGDGGRIAVVLPRAALAARGSAEFREAVFAGGESVDITTLLNKGGWVFDGAEHRYTVALVAICKRGGQRASVYLRGPYRSRERYDGGVGTDGVKFDADDIRSWTDTYSLPLFPSEDSVEVFAQLRRSPRLDLNDRTTWRCRPIQGDLNSTTNKPLMDLKSTSPPEGSWPVFSGESFDLWTPDTGAYYAYVQPRRVLEHLQKRRVRGGRLMNSPFSEFEPRSLRDPETLPCLRPRIAFRDVTNRTNQRTVIAALVPAKVILVHQAPYLLWPRGSAHDEAYLLGVLCSMVLDWYARRFVETHLSFVVLNPFPIPRPPPEDPTRLRVIELAGRLACADRRFIGWAREIGVKWGEIEEDVKADMVAELDALVAHLYGLSEKQLVHIFETFHEGWDYADRLEATLGHFKGWKKRT